MRGQGKNIMYEKRSAPATKQPLIMTESLFWESITLYSPYSGQGAEKVVKFLEKYPLKEIWKWDIILKNKRDELDSLPEFYEKCVKAYQGMSDDSWTDFRNWLLAFGEDKFNQLLNNPDHIFEMGIVPDSQANSERAQKIEGGALSFCFAEILGYSADYAAQNKGEDLLQAYDKYGRSL